LHEAAAVATIFRFELVEPSLEEIFIKTVGGKSENGRTAGGNAYA